MNFERLYRQLVIAVDRGDRAAELMLRARIERVEKAEARGLRIAA